MSPTILLTASALLGLLLGHSQTASAESVCQAGGKKEVAAACSIRVEKERYYVIEASAEAMADKSSEGQLWMDVFVDDTKKGHAETVCGGVGPCRVTVVLQMLLKANKVYKIEARQGNNRADTHFTRVSVKTAES
jgi:5,10-methylene-tetrahydrofolate dehydrogenase/methenyl tetrahydrofolate cyclohydrolase